MQLFKQQGDYFDIPTSTLTPLQIREKLANLAASLDSKLWSGDAGAKFKDLLTLKSSPNGGVAVTDDLKYTSETVLRQLSTVYSCPHQSSFLDRTAFTSRQRYSGMVLLRTRYPPRGERRSGPNSSRRRLQFEQIIRSHQRNCTVMSINPVINYNSNECVKEVSYRMSVKPEAKVQLECLSNRKQKYSYSYSLKIQHGRIR